MGEEKSSFATPPDKIALCLSGGGLRASFFHFGTIKALRNAGLISKVSHIFAVSGGSILAGHIACNWDRYQVQSKDYDKAENEFLSLADLDLRGRIIRRGILTALTLLLPKKFWKLRIGPVEHLEREYRRLYRNKTFAETQLNSPKLHILATNLITGELISFSKDGYHLESQNEDGKSQEELIDYDRIPLSFAVAASSAFPPMFPPMQLRRQMLAANVEKFPVSPHLLTDGGIFDNLGVEKALLMIDRHKLSVDLILVSDAGGIFDWDVKSTFFWPLSRTVRTVNILMNRVSEGTIVRSSSQYLKTKLLLCKIGSTTEHGLPKAIQKRLRSIRTDLDRFNAVEVDSLVNHGEKVASGQLEKTYGKTSTSLHKYFEIDKVGGKSIAEASKILEKSWKRRLGLFYGRDWASYPLFIILFLTISIPIYFLAVLPRFELDRASEAIASASENGSKLINSTVDLQQSLDIAKAAIKILELNAIQNNAIEEKCRDPSHGIERYKNVVQVSRQSGWMGGGHSQPEWCKQVIGLIRADYPSESEFKIAKSGEDNRSKCNPFNCPEYRYNCTIAVSSNPVYVEKASPACTIRKIQ